MGAGEVVRKALADLLGGLAVEGEHKDLAWRDAPVADEVGDLAGDHGGLARARTGEHQRGVLVRGDGRCACSAVGGEESTPWAAWATAGAVAAMKRAFAASLAASNSSVRATGWMRASASAGCAGRNARVRAPPAALHGAGDVGLEPAGLRLPRIAAAGMEAVQAVVQLCEVRRQRSGKAGGLREYRRGEPLGLLAGEPADGMLGAAGLAHGQSRPEPRAARLGCCRFRQPACPRRPRSAARRRRARHVPGQRRAAERGLRWWRSHWAGTSAPSQCGLPGPRA